MEFCQIRPVWRWCVFYYVFGCVDSLCSSIRILVCRSLLSGFYCYTHFIVYFIMHSIVHIIIYFILHSIIYSIMHFIIHSIVHSIVQFIVQILLYGLYYTIVHSIVQLPLRILQILLYGFYYVLYPIDFIMRILLYAFCIL